MYDEFTDKVSFVTGATSGIGRATAVAFARDGAHVAVIGRNADRGAETVELCRKAGGEAVFLAADMSRPDDIQRAVAATVDRFGRLDYALNNAGSEGHAASLDEHTDQSWDQVLDTNLKGMWLCLKHQLQHMINHDGGAIVNMTSVYGFIGGPGRGPYSASKHGIIGLTKSAALENARRGVRINAIAPGYVVTAMVERTTPGADAQHALAEQQPIGRGARPEEIADAVTWLCSNRASYVLGHTLVIDGGWTIS
jgi:NAD(P)-dependent dehydrogenase (short-subunit alcohol dehydrogenase family)